jgi:hypothetical protein
VKKRLKSILQNRTVALQEWNSVHILGRVPGHSARFCLAYKLQEWLHKLWAWAYDGSLEEVQDALEFIASGVQEKYLTPNQIEIKRRLCEWVDATETH